MKSRLAVFALSAIGLAVVLPAWADTRIYVQLAPPVAVVETKLAAPSARHVWVAGYHRWDGAAFVWVPGRWAIPPSHHHAWVAGHWAHAKHGYYWSDGHWR